MSQPRASKRAPAAASKAAATSARRSAKRAYHHGDLERAMIAATIAIIEEEGAAALSVRAAAKRAGVSPGAPFRHFASRKALLTAVAEEATEALQRDVAAAVAKARAKPPAARLKAIASAYLTWALANPARFDIVSNRRLIDYEESPTLRARNDDTRALLDGAIAAVLLDAGGSARPELVRDLRIEMRGLGYGLARMAVDGHFTDWAVPGEQPTTTIKRITDRFIDRLANRT